MTLKRLDTATPTWYAPNKGGVLWQLFYVGDAVNTSELNAPMLSGAHCVERLKTRKNLADTKGAIRALVLTAGNRLSEGQSVVGCAITRLAQAISLPTKTRIGVVVKLGAMAMSIFESEAPKKGITHIGVNTLLFGKKLKANHSRKDGLFTTSTASRMTTASRTWLRCLESVMAVGWLSSLTNNASRNSKHNFAKSKLALAS